MSSSGEKQENEDRRKRKRLEADLGLEDSRARHDTFRRMTRSSFGSPAKTEGAGSSKQIHIPSTSRQPAAVIRRQIPDRGPTRLPPRLFPDALIPGGGRINSYSHPEHLLALRDILKGTEELDYILESPFGNLFKIQARKAGLSGKLVHQFICRSLVTRKKHEIWFVFGGKPIRYSLKEFCYLTGLNCGPYPPESVMTALRKDSVGPNAFWKRLIGKREHCLVTDILDILRYDMAKHPKERMSGGRRLRLALVVIVDGILNPNSSSGKASREVVEQVRDVSAFLDYPWGRKSFDLTLEMIMFGNKFNATADILRDKLSTSHLTIHGFTLALQLHILTTVPMVCELLPDKDIWLPNLLDESIKDLPKFRSYHNDNIRKIENNPRLQVISILGFGFPLKSDHFSWQDEIEDPAVDYLLEQLRVGHSFRPEDWVVGDIEIPVVPVQPLARDNVLALPKTKQGTIRKLWAGKGKESKKTTTQKGKAIEICDIDGVESTDSSDEDAFFQSGRSRIIEIVDLVLAEIKSRKHRRGKGTEKKNKGVKPLKIGRDDSVKVSEVCELGKKVAMSVSGGSGPKETSDQKSSEQLVSPEQGDEISKMLNVVITELDEGRNGDNEGSRGVTEDCGNTIATGGPSVVLGEETTPLEVMSPEQRGVEVMSPEKAEHIVAPVDDLSLLVNIDGHKDISTTEGVNTDDAAKLDVEAELDLVVDLDSERVFRNEGETEQKTVNEDELLRMEDDLLRMEDADEHGSDEEDTAADGGDVDNELSDNEELGDGTKAPLRSKRERKMPQKYGQDEFDSSDAAPEGKDLGSIDERSRKHFFAKLGAYKNSDFTVNGHKQGNEFFKQIYKPKNHVGTEHINAMLCCVWRRMSSYLLERRIVILDTWFTELLDIDHTRYMKKRRGDSSFVWNNTLRKYVIGEVENRAGRVGWLVDVDVVYAPMVIGKDHWVAICIELKNGKVVVYDSNIDKNSEDKLIKAIKPVTDILPALIEEVALTAQSAYTPPTKFVHDRPTNVYQNKRSGDCGPLSVKFIEERSQGLPVDGFTDRSVDSIRMMYAMEAFSEFVEPLAF